MDVALAEMMSRRRIAVLLLGVVSLVAVTLILAYWLGAVLMRLKEVSRLLAGVPFLGEWVIAPLDKIFMGYGGFLLVTSTTVALSGLLYAVKVLLTHPIDEISKPPKKTAAYEASGRVQPPTQSSPGLQQPETQKRPVCTLGVDEDNRARGVYQDERVHMAVVGYPDTGKSRFLLSLLLQHVWRGEGGLVMDPHGDLAKIFLSHIPRERWDDVVYIDPKTAMDYGRVVQINFLEYRDVKDRDVVARSFMESLEKIYTRFWGPRLDMILLNAIYLLLDAGNTNLGSLYRVIADEDYRENLLIKVKDDRVAAFWRNEYKRMPKDASSSALTKIYRIVQERIVAPIFECEESSVDLRKLMDERKIVVVNLSEGAITSDVANFLGSLILARIYLAGMGREDTPEEKRVPFYVYIDEAPRFATSSIKDILQSLRKYKVYMTLASQYLGQYRKDVAEAIPSLCDTIICFSVAEDTAKALEEFYRPSLNYQHLIHLPRYRFAASAIIGGQRECQVLKSIDYGWGKNKLEGVIEHSLKKHGREIDMSKFIGVPAVGDLPHPRDRDLYTPPPWIILLNLWRLYEENLGSGMYSVGTTPSIEHDDLNEILEREFGFSASEVATTINHLSVRGWIHTRERPYEWEGVMVPVEAPWQPNPVQCELCGELTSRPYVQRNGKVLCRICVERALHQRTRMPNDFISPILRERDIRFDLTVHRSKTHKYYSITPTARQLFFDPVPRGRRGGGPEHAAVIGEVVRSLWAEYSFSFVDVGEEAPKKKLEDETVEYEYETKRLPDIVVYPLAKTKAGEVDPRHWDNAHSYAVEVEINPIKHPFRVLSNLKKCRNWGLPTLLVTTRPEWARGLVRILQDHYEQVVSDCTGQTGPHDPKKASVLYIDLESRTKVAVTSPETALTGEEMKGGVKPLETTQEPQTTGEVKGETLEGERPTETAEEKTRVESTTNMETKITFYAGSNCIFRKRLVDGEWRLIAKKQVGLKVFEEDLGPYNEETERTLKLLKIEAPVEPPQTKAAATRRKPAPSPPAETENEKAPAQPEQPPATAEAKPKIEESETPQTPNQPEQPQTTSERAVRTEGAAIGTGRKTKGKKVEERQIQEYANLGYSFRIKRSGNKIYLYADKWVEGRSDSPYLGLFDEETKRIFEKLGFKVKGLCK